MHDVQLPARPRGFRANFIARSQFEARLASLRRLDRRVVERVEEIEGVRCHLEIFATDGSGREAHRYEAVATWDRGDGLEWRKLAADFAPERLYGSLIHAVQERLKGSDAGDPEDQDQHRLHNGLTSPS